MTATIHHGDCLDVLRDMPDNSVDAVVCDPPYGLSNTSPDKVTETIVRWAQGDREYVPTGKGFMGASWDAFVPPAAVWDECIRVLKPGGHLVAFAGSRTQDLMGLAIRLAGFDVRENLAWLYGSGFPKSMDIAKAIDKSKTLGDSKIIVKGCAWIANRCDELGLTRKDLDAAAGTSDMGGWWASRLPHRANLPTAEQWEKLKPILGDAPEWLDKYILPANAPGEAWASADVLRTDERMNEPSGIVNVGQGERTKVVREIKAPNSDHAERWQGWGTALKPAHEPIILARKPLIGTVAANTLTWGTGGLNIDKTRIGTQPAGRWPSNVVLDPDTAKALDLQSGNRPGFKSQNDHKETQSNYFGADKHPGERQGYNDEGGASRFFKVVEPDPPFMYAAKAPKRERPSYTTEDGQTVQHATVKPLSIMSWLVKLVTPEGGTVLDPFAGSGTTVEAAILEGFNVIGIEREAEYLPLIQQRIDRATDAPPMAS